MVQKLLPADVGGVVFAQYNRPVAGLDLTGASFDARGLTRQGSRTRLRTTIDVDPGIGGVMQYAEHSFIRERLPNDIILGTASPGARGKAKTMLGKVLHHGQGRATVNEKRKEQAYRLLDFFVGIEHEALSGIEHIPGWRAKPQRPALGFGLLTAEQTVAQPMQLRLALTWSSYLVHPS